MDILNYDVGILALRLRTDRFRFRFSKFMRINRFKHSKKFNGISYYVCDEEYVSICVRQNTKLSPLT